MLAIRPVLPTDAAEIMAFVRELAEYERLGYEVDADEAGVSRALFGPDPRVFADMAIVDGEPAGLALWFYTFSTFRGRHGIWLEDLYVRPAYRGRGAGKALMAGLARRCLDEDLARMEWWVLDWNDPAIAVYRRIGAVPMGGWTVQRLTGGALEALAESAA